MKRRISLALAFLTILSAVLSSGFVIPALADDPVDTFRWAFWNSQPAPIDENIAAETQNIAGVTSYPSLALTLSSGPSGGSGEGPEQVLSDNQSSKWCSTSAAPGANLNFVFDAGANYANLDTPVQYVIRGANDDTGYSGRCLSAFNLAGATSTSGPWTTIDTRSGVSWNSSNYYLNTYNISPAQKYRYYRLNITARCNANGGTVVTTSGTMQFSYFGLRTSTTQVSSGNYVIPTIAANPGAMIDGTNAPWNGENVLYCNGTVASGSGTVLAKSYTVVRKDLNVEVFPDTKLSYCINPQYGSSYDNNFTSAHSAIDLLFTDGTRLKDLGAKDYFGFPMTPVGQGQSKCLYMNTWNFVESNIGDVAAGKVVEAIIIGFEMPAAARNAVIRAAFDDIQIYRRDDPALIAATELADFADVRFGTRVGTYGNGACSPLVGTPNPFNYWVPATGTSTTSPYNSQGRSFYYIRMSHQASRWFSESDTMTIMADSSSSGIRTGSGSTFTKDREFAVAPYHYGIQLAANDSTAPNVKVEVTPLEHSAVFRFTWPSNATRRNVHIAALSGTPARGTASGTGTNTFTAVASSNNYSMKAEQIFGSFSANPSTFTAASGSLYLRFDENPTGPNGETVVELKIGTSMMSQTQAQVNLLLELDADEWFDAAMAKSKKIWNDVFASTAIDDPTANYWDLVDFYSKYARTCMYPTIMHENTRATNTTPAQIAAAKANPRIQYASPYRTSSMVIRDGYFSYNEGFWDTFRSKWTALAFFRPSDVGRLFDGMVSAFKDQDGRGSWGIPRWIKPAGSELMVMTSSDIIAAELYARGVQYDHANGYAAALKDSTAAATGSFAQGGRPGTNESIYKGYTPWGTANPAGGGGQLDTSWAIEGYTNDAGEGRMAAGLRDEQLAIAAAATDPAVKEEALFQARQYNDESIYLINRGKHYVNIFNPTNTGSVSSAGWLMNKNRAGAWLGGNGSTSTTFNALDWGWGFCEDNAYNYVISVTQDGKGLANLFGGKTAFGNKMRHIFSDAAWAQSIRGGGYGGAIHEAYEKREVKIGQWGLSNEPGEHMAAMWLFTDTPAEAGRYTRMGMQRAGGSIQVGRGMIGEEDNGAMASWWVWAYMGLYPLDQGSGNVVVTSPRFKKVTFDLDDGRNFVFLAPNAGPQNYYVNGISIQYGGTGPFVPYNKTYFTQDLFDNGNVFMFDMSNVANDWAKNAEAPPSLTEKPDGIDYRPDVMMDICDELAASSTLSAMPSPTRTTSAAYVTNATTSGNNSAMYLFDNASASTTASAAGTKTTYDVNFSARTTAITYYSPVPKKVEMYTITSSNTAGADPKAWAFKGSNDGVNWDVLDERVLPNLLTYNNSAVTTEAGAATKTSETFRWRRQCKPFAIDPDKMGLYKYYQIDVTASSSTTNLSIAQIELLAYVPDWDLNPTIAVAGNTATITANVRNNQFKTDNASLYAALYSADGKLLDVVSRTGNVAAITTSANISSAIAINTANAGAGYYIKVFLWKPDTFVPLAQSWTFQY